MAPQELEKSASKYAAAAIRADSQGAAGMAITDYQNASDTLLKLIRLYPTSSLNKIYKQCYQKYHDRIQALRDTNGADISIILVCQFSGMSGVNLCIVYIFGNIYRNISSFAKFFEFYMMKGIPFWKILIVTFILGIIVHRIFCVKTTIDKLLFS